MSLFAKAVENLYRDGLIYCVDKSTGRLHDVPALEYLQDTAKWNSERFSSFLARPPAEALSRSIRYGRN